MIYQRVESVIDVAVVRKKIVTAIGCGGFAGAARNLARCGLEHFRLVDRDLVGPENLCRQDYMADQVGQSKVSALAAELMRINDGITAEVFPCDFCEFPDGSIDSIFGDTDLFVFATDNHEAQARGNEVCLRLNKPGVWIGMYPEGAAGEIFFWRPGMEHCYRCTLAARYVGQAEMREDPPSVGADVLAVTFLDSLAGMIIIGLLTDGAHNRYGRLLRQLKGRQFLQIKIDPEFGWNGKDFFREELGIPEGNDAYLSFCTIARRDPDPGGLCPDCRKFRQPGPVRGTMPGDPHPEPSKL